jgi:hypothetical protein
MDALATEAADPSNDSLLRHAQTHSDLRDTPAVPDGEDGEETLELASVALLLGSLQSPFHSLTGVRGEGNTDATQRDIPPKTTGERCFFGRHFPDVWRRVNPSSANLCLKQPFWANHREKE